MVLTLSEYDSLAYGIAWSPDGSTIATGHLDGAVILWNAESGSLLLTIPGPPLTDQDMAYTIGSGRVASAYTVNDVAFSPDGSLLASASEDGTITLWEIGSGDEVMRLSRHVGPVRSLDWSPDGTRLVTGGNDGLPRIWDVMSGETQVVLLGHTDEVAEVEWSPDGERIATQSQDVTVKLWDADTGKLLLEIRNAGPHWTWQLGYAAFSRDGDELMTGGSRLLGQVHVWDISESSLTLFGHTLGQEWGGWSPDGTLIATSGMDGKTGIWDAATGEMLYMVDNGPGWSAWSPDSTRLAIPGAGNSLYIVDARSGETLSESSLVGMTPFLVSAN